MVMTMTMTLGSRSSRGYTSISSHSKPQVNYAVYMHHRRRINTKVDATVWGTEFNQLLATLAILYQDDLKKRINTIMATWLNVYLGKMAETSPNL